MFVKQHKEITTKLLTDTGYRANAITASCVTEKLMSMHPFLSKPVIS